jgi:hypothetical protein
VVGAEIVSKDDENINTHTIVRQPLLFDELNVVARFWQ